MRTGIKVCVLISLYHLEIGYGCGRQYATVKRIAANECLNWGHN